MSKPTIESLHNPRVKQASQLRDHRQRKKQGRFLIDGAREVDRAMQAGVELAEVFVCEALCTTDESRRVLARLGDASARESFGNPDIWHVSAAVLEKIAYGERAEGVVAVGRVRTRALE